MKIEVNIEKKHAFMILGAILIIGGIFAVNAYGTSNPSQFGHSASEVAPGAFNGDQNSKWALPGKLVVGQGSQDSIGRNLLINDTGAFAGIGISSSGAGGNTYLDFIKNGQVKANLNWNGSEFYVNDYGSKTIINSGGGSVGVGKSPVSAPVGVSGRVLDVYGAICLNGVCKGKGDSSGVWGTPGLDTVGFVAQLDPNSGGAGYQEVKKTLTVQAQGVTFGSSASFCALSQTQYSGTITSSAGVGCYVYIDSGTNIWTIKAYRNNVAEGVSCRAICMIN